VSFYKAVSIFARSYADIAQDMSKPGYSDAEALVVTLLYKCDLIHKSVKNHVPMTA
jgi:hypothetical protein